MKYKTDSARLNTTISPLSQTDATAANYRKRNANLVPSALIFAIASGVLLSLVHQGNHLHLIRTAPPMVLGVFPLSFQCDGLASLFMGLLSIILISISFYSPSYLNHFKDRIQMGGYWTAMFLFVGSMYGVVLSADAVTFLVLWEIMSLSSAALVASDYSHRVVQKSAMIYLGATRIATALLCGGFLAMHAVTGSWSFADWTFSSSSSYVAGCLILLAFCIKAGIWPFHIWLPYTHPAAPSTVSALMSGFTIKIAIYGIMRILVCGGLNSPEIINLALFLGAVSTFWGILFALVQNDLKRLLAYSSIENIGMILIAIALGLKAKLAGLEALALVAFVAATFHCMNHGLFKSLLFLCAGTIDTQAHTRDLRRLGGLAKQMPWTAACFLGGSLAICSIPPLNGFASKWLIYQTFFKTTYETSSYLDRGIAFAGICLLSVVGGLTIATFVKAIGVSFLGNARSKSAEIAREAKLGMVVAPLFLLIVCVTLGVGAAQSVPFIAKALVETPGLQSLASPDQLQATVQFPIPMNMIALSLFSMSALIYMFFLKTSRTRKYSTWDCGFGTLSTRTQVSSDSFAQPMARIFRPILKYQAKLKIDGDDCRHFPEKVNVEVQMVSILESRIYLPTLALISHASKYLAKLQAGSIHLYLLYVCITLVVLLLVGVHL